MPAKSIQYQDLLQPIEGDKNLCFLIGAGISGNLPGTKSIIKAILYTLSYPLGEQEALKISNSLLNQSLIKDIDFPIRLEYLLQLLKDYFRTDFSFFKKLFECNRKPNMYQATLSNILNESDHVLFTTNFDTKIEKQSIRPEVYRDIDFQRTDLSKQLSGIYKLHGSITNTSTLGVTFDSITKKAHKNKKKVFEAGLRQGSLCVIGYSGGDDTDVVPTVIHAKAFQRRVYWFQHLNDKEINNTKDRELINRHYKCYPFSNIPSIPAELKRKQSFRILEQMIKLGSRDKKRIFLIGGDSQKAFFHFLRLRNIEIKEGEEKFSPPQWWVNLQVKNWYQHEISLFNFAEKDKDILATIVGTVLTYIVGKGDLPQRFGKILESTTKSRPEWYPIALPKLAMVSYDADDSSKAAKQAQKALTLLRDYPRTEKRVPRQLVEEAHIDSYIWLAESLRMEQKPSNGIYIAKLGLQKMQMLEKLSEFKRLIRLKGDLHAAIGESFLVLGQLKQAKQEYARSIKYMKESSEWYWYWYGQLGIADILRAEGEFKSAQVQYAKVNDGSYASGWRTWMTAQIKISEFDIKRTQMVELNQDQIYELNWLASGKTNRYDRAIVYAAKSILWDIDWIFKRKTKEQLTLGYKKLISMAEGDEDFIASLRLSHSEYLKHNGKHKQAQKEISSVIKHANDAGYILLELHARLIYEDLNRMMNKPANWHELYTQYKKHGCIIGEIYATILGMLCGARIRTPILKKLYKATLINEIPWAYKVLVNDNSAKIVDKEAWFLFPGVITTF